MPYVAPYRRAVLTLLESQAPFAADDLRAVSEQTSLPAARAQATRLCRQGVLREVGPGQFMAGPRAAAYRAMKPKSKPGGNAKLYKERLATQARLKGLGWQRQRSGAEQPDLTSAEPRPCDNGDMVSAAAAARMVGVSRWTMARWARAGRIRSVVTLGGHMRVDRRQIERIAPWLKKRQRRKRLRKQRGGGSKSGR